MRNLDTAIGVAAVWICTAIICAASPEHAVDVVGYAVGATFIVAILI